MKPIIKLQSVVLDCLQPAELAKFYASLLDGEIVFDIEHFITLAIPGETFSLSFQLDEDYTPPVWPDSPKDQMKMLHLDFSVKDMDAAVQFALSLGATKPLVQYWQSDYGPQWVTLLDPAGHPFCLCYHE
jgi:hypothetical protein